MPTDIPSPDLLRRHHAHWRVPGAPKPVPKTVKPGAETVAAQQP